MHPTNRILLSALLCIAAFAPLTIAPATAQQTWKQLPGQEKYTRPYEPFRVVGNLPTLAPMISRCS